MSDAIPPYRQRAGAVTIRELTAGLIWPELFRVIGLSVHPARVLIGTLTALALFGGAWLIERASGSTAFGTLGLAWPTGGSMPGNNRLVNMLNQWAIQSNTPDVIGAIVFASIILILGGGAIARSAALDFAVDLDPGFRKSIRFAFSRMGMLLGAALIPLIVIGALLGVIWVFGLALMSWSPGDAMGGVLWGLPALLGVFAALLGALYLFGFVMLPGAAACEDTDAGDAIQRVFAYLVAKPHRFVAYAVVLVVQLYIAHIVFQAIMREGLGAAIVLAGANESGFAVDAIHFWQQAAWLVFIGWALSFVFSGGALLYLFMRRVCDEQDIREVRLTSVVIAGATKTSPEQDQQAEPPPSGGGAAR